MRRYGEVLLFLLVAVAVTSTVSAARISPAEASAAARSFVTSGRHLGARLGSEPAAVDESGGLYSVRMRGGGTVFLTTDDDRGPVVAFTSADVDITALAAGSPMRALFARDAVLRRGTSAAPARWSRLLPEEPTAAAGITFAASTLAAVPLTAPGDVRVPALVKTRWDQKTDRSWNRCFNLYTPGNCYCGCVATAMAQVMRHHRWPDGAHPVASAEVECFRYNAKTAVTESLPLVLQGGTYDWDAMPSDADGDRISTDAQRAAIGRLVSDAGISVAMVYGDNGSAAYSGDAQRAFMANWRYGQSCYLYDYFDYGYGYINGVYGEKQRETALAKAVFSNLDAGCPVLLGISGEGGHCVVIDGYGYDDGVDFVHLNLGWQGDGDLWYNLPAVAASYDFDSCDDLVYNVFPTNGTDCAAFSGRVVDADSRAVVGATVRILRAGTDETAAELVTSSSGVYGAILPGGRDYDVVAVSADLSLTSSVRAARLPLPDARNEPGVHSTRTVTADGQLGNSWGNDIVLGDEKGRRTMPAEFYVSAADGVDAPDRGTSAAPFATIRYALADDRELIDGDVIRVLPGTYRGCVEVPAVKVSIVSTGGPQVTVIDGEGLDCCYCGELSPDSLLAGFTLTNGANYGGIFIGSASNCVIVGCENGAATAGYGGGAYAARLEGCVLSGNAAYYGGGAAASTLVNCTVSGNSALYAGGGVDCDSVLTNSIVWENRLIDDGSVDNWELYRVDFGQVIAPSFARSCTVPAGYVDLGGNISDDPRFASSAAGDFRLRAGSPCLGAGFGGLNMGAWQGEGLVGYEIVAHVNGCGTVEPPSRFVPEGGDAAFEAFGSHPFVGFRTNGVFASSSRVFVWRSVGGDGVLTADFGSTNFWLDAERGDDAADGLTEATALRTLGGVVDKAGAGDRVFARPGVYAGCDWCVPGLAIESTDGPGVTVVDGGGTGACVYAEGMLYRGFTFRNGRYAAGYGGGVYGGAFVDSVISNCSAAAGGGAAFAALTNCLVTGNDARSLKYGKSVVVGEGGGVYACELVNCTVSGNLADRHGGGVFLTGSAPVLNSIVCGNTNTAGSAAGDDVYGTLPWAVTNSLVGVDARFRDPVRGDWRLTPRSPAFDAGSSDFVALERDLDGAARVWGTAVDMGCYEYRLPSPATADPGVTPDDTAETRAAKLAAALAEEGFRDEFAEAVKTPGDYAYLIEWAAANGVTRAAHNASDTALLSPALGADGLVDAGGRLKIVAFDVEETRLALAFELPDYDPAKLDPALLGSAIGVVTGATPDALSAADRSTYALAPGASNVVITVAPAPAGSRFFGVTAR